MSTDLLAGTKSKIGRAKKHLADLGAEISAYHGRTPYRIISDRQSKPGHELYRFEFTEAIPCEWGPVVGDIVHNLRGALDTLATAMVVANGKTSNSVIQNTYFPIGATEQVFNEKLPADLRGASEAARAMVKELKPYKGGTDTFWQLHRLDILDKHTALIPVGAGHTNIIWKANFTGLREMMGLTGSGPDVPPVVFNPNKTQFPLKNGDVVFDYGFGDDKDGKFQGEFKFTFDVAFGEGQIIDGQPLIPCIQQFVDFVERTVEIFDRRLFNPA